MLSGKLVGVHAVGVDWGWIAPSFDQYDYILTLIILSRFFQTFQPIFLFPPRLISHVEEPDPFDIERGALMRQE